MLLINFKAYEESSGENALKIAKICERVSKKLGVDIGVVPGFLDLGIISKKVKIPVFSQGVSVYEPGAHTGSITAKSLKKIGVYGVVLNHAENRIDFKTMKESFKISKKYSLKVLLCAKDIREARKLARLKPDYIAIEPPELIGGKISVSSAKPDIISKGVSAVKKISKRTKVLVGAGVHTREDVEKALKFGAHGVFVASAVCKAKHKEKIIKELGKGLL